MTMINIGCGRLYHTDWINLDSFSVHPSILEVDVTRGLPFADGTVSVCYSSHLIEHLSKDEAFFLVSECFRVMKKGAIIRLAVPDLEKIVLEYLSVLNKLSTEDDMLVTRYNWIMLELFDQMVRLKPGGEMAEFLQNIPSADRKFIRDRIGSEMDQILTTSTKDENKHPHRSLLYRIRNFRLWIAKNLVRFVLDKKAGENFEQGLFRANGEVHRWMYDRYSLKSLLNKGGFSEFRLCQANESQIPNYQFYELDVVNGLVRKPDSIFVEARKL